jgi:hypothetical protein
VRLPVDSTRIRAFARQLGREARTETRLYLTGGATAVLRGWRTTTLDRHSLRARDRLVNVHNFDFYAQALSKIERGFAQDLADVAAMLRDGVVDRQRLRDLFAQVEPSLFRYPAIDPDSFRAKVDRALR